jgi:alkanesulfonate monooxygenase SsuD/methylene tetrahydromethanopterin reductase-like flavin-dependent oxidoreductase (luciferase family)
VELGDGWLGVGGPLESVARRVKKTSEFARQAGKSDFVVAVGATPETNREDVDQLRQAGATHINVSFTSGTATEIESGIEAVAARFLG